jgi:hypothetical protein
MEKLRGFAVQPPTAKIMAHIGVKTGCSGQSIFKGVAIQTWSIISSDVFRIAGV